VRLNPNRRLLCAVGDGVESVILDVRTGNGAPTVGVRDAVTGRLTVVHQNAVVYVPSAQSRSGCRVTRTTCFPARGRQMASPWQPPAKTGQPGTKYLGSEYSACVTILTSFGSLHRLPFRRLYDIRQPNSPFKVLRSIMEVPRSLQYTSDGRFLVIGEGLDLVSIVDAASGYTEGQLLDFFGTAGPALSCVRAASLIKPPYVSRASLLMLLRRRHWRRGGHARCRDAHRVQLRPRVRVLDRV